MANPNYGAFPNADGWRGLSSRIKIGLAASLAARSDFAGQQNLNGRFDWVGPGAGRPYRGDLLTPQFLLRPILHRIANAAAAGQITTAPGTNPIRSGVVTQIPSANSTLSTLDRVRNNAR